MQPVVDGRPSPVDCRLRFFSNGGVASFSTIHKSIQSLEPLGQSIWSLDTQIFDRLCLQLETEQRQWELLGMIWEVLILSFTLSICDENNRLYSIT